jgi:CRISPR/Cas system CMR-associated protein Cmr5 small subunit
MPKQLKQKQNKNKNKNSRKKRGGSGEKMHFLASLKANTQIILADIERMEDELPEGEPVEHCNLSEIKKNAIQANVLINNLIEEQQNADSTAQNPLDQVITTNGFTGTVGELLSKIREKIAQLSKYNNEGHEQAITHLKTLLNIGASESVNINNIKEILKGGKIKFKNNKLVVAKTKSRRNNKRQKKQTKQTKRR